MRVIFCGSRDWKNPEPIRRVMLGLQKQYGKRLLVVEGEARGADILSKEIAKELGVRVKKFPADWAQFGDAAGPVRNAEMLNYILLDKERQVVAFHNFIIRSKGTKNMVEQAKKAGVFTRVVREEKGE